MTQQQIEECVSRWSYEVNARYYAGKISEAKCCEELEDIAVWARNALRRLHTRNVIRSE